MKKYIPVILLLTLCILFGGMNCAFAAERPNCTVTINGQAVQEGFCLSNPGENPVLALYPDAGSITECDYTIFFLDATGNEFDSTFLNNADPLKTSIVLNESAYAMRIEYNIRFLDINGDPGSMSRAVTVRISWPEEDLPEIFEDIRVDGMSIQNMMYLPAQHTVTLSFNAIRDAEEYVVRFNNHSSWQVPYSGSDVVSFDFVMPTECLNLCVLAYDSSERAVLLDESDVYTLLPAEATVNEQLSLRVSDSNPVARNTITVTNCSAVAADLYYIELGEIGYRVATLQPNETISRTVGIPMTEILYLMDDDGLVSPSQIVIWGNPIPVPDAFVDGKPLNDCGMLDIAPGEHVLSFAPTGYDDIIYLVNLDYYDRDFNLLRQTSIDDDMTFTTEQNDGRLMFSVRIMVPGYPFASPRIWEVAIGMSANDFSRITFNGSELPEVNAFEKTQIQWNDIEGATDYRVTLEGGNGMTWFQTTYGNTMNVYLTGNTDMVTLNVSAMDDENTVLATSSPIALTVRTSFPAFELTADITECHPTSSCSLSANRTGLLYSASPTSIVGIPGIQNASSWVQWLYNIGTVTYWVVDENGQASNPVSVSCVPLPSCETFEEILLGGVQVTQGMVIPAGQINIRSSYVKDNGTVYARFWKNEACTDLRTTATLYGGSAIPPTGSVMVQDGEYWLQLTTGDGSVSSDIFHLFVGERSLIPPVPVLTGEDGVIAGKDAILTFEPVNGAEIYSATAVLHDVSGSRSCTVLRTEGEYADVSGGAFRLLPDTASVTVTVTAYAEGKEEASATGIFDVSGTVSVMPLPSDLKIIEAEAFAGTDLEMVILPDGCESIGSKAFAGGSLKYVWIPASVESIAADAFDPDVRIYGPDSAAETERLAHSNGFTYNEREGRPGTESASVF